MTSYSLVDSSKVALDAKLDVLFKNKTNGFFIELGAHDGLTQSNTAFFEFSRGWKGILIEPSISQFEKCAVNRPNSVCFNAACVSNTFTESSISGNFDGTLMASVGGIRNNPTKVSTSVPAKTLSSIIDSISPRVEIIDLLSLDTEGYELDILQGLDLVRHRPHYMLIEVYTKDYEAIVAFLKLNRYELHSNFSNYNKQLNPIWDGTHNDYLFVDTA
jgi:FkbM family methyltransferase